MISTASLLGLLHTLGMALWLGGFSFAFLTLRHDPATLASALKRYQWVALASLVAIAGTGGARVALLGGMKALPVLVHVKITLGLVMALLTLVLFFNLLPKAQANPAEGGKALNTVLGLTCLTGVAVLVLLAVVGLL